MSKQTNAVGCLLGVACGDALGRPIEFRSADQIASRHGRVEEMLGNGTHRKPPGTITDDTEMALCIAESLVDRQRFQPADIADRFVGWLNSGPFDIGLMTRQALGRIDRGVAWDDAGVREWESRPEGSNAGNGSVMRCAPHAIAYSNSDAVLEQVSRRSSSITHADPRCQWGCVILNRTLASLISDEPEPLTRALSQTTAAPAELRDALTAVQDVLSGGQSPDAFEPKLATTGYVVDSLQAALYLGLTAESAEAAIVDAVNRGGDTDTVGAITGALAGARFGVGAIPDRWTDEIDEADRLRQLARTLSTLEMQSLDQELTLPGTDSLVTE